MATNGKIRPILKISTTEIISVKKRMFGISFFLDANI